MISTEENFELAYIISKANFTHFEEPQWSEMVVDISTLAKGNPHKMKYILDMLHDVEPFRSKEERKMYNTYLELMLFMADKINIPNERNT